LMNSQPKSRKERVEAYTKPHAAAESTGLNATCHLEGAGVCCGAASTGASRAATAGRWGGGGGGAGEKQLPGAGCKVCPCIEGWCWSKARVLPRPFLA